VRLPSQHCGLGPAVLSSDDKRCGPASRRGRLELTSNLSTRVLWPSPETSLEPVGNGRRKWKFSLFIPVGLQEFSNMPLNLTTWDLPALLSIRKEGVLRIFIALKSPSPWPGSNPQPLGPVASTLTTTPSRRLCCV
jgi:hypothetical protein